MNPIELSEQTPVVYIHAAFPSPSAWRGILKAVDGRHWHRADHARTPSTPALLAIIAWSAKSIFWPGILQPRPNRRLVEIEGASHFLIQSYAEACAAIIEEDLSGGI